MKQRPLLSCCLVLMGASLLMTAPAEAQEPSGFLSDYSGLEPDPDDKSILVYGDHGQILCKYKKVFVQPVQIFLHEKTGEKVNEEAREMLKQYTFFALIEGFRAVEWLEFAEPGPGVIEINTAISDVLNAKRTLNVILPSKLTGIGRGGAALEEELVDSETGEQLAAFIRAGKGSRFDMRGLKKYGHARKIIEGWAKDAATRLSQWDCE